MPLHLVIAVMFAFLPFWPVCTCIPTKYNSQVPLDLVIEVSIDIPGLEKPNRATLSHCDLDGSLRLFDGSVSFSGGSLRFFVSAPWIVEILDSPETIS